MAALAQSAVRVAAPVAFKASKAASPAVPAAAAQCMQVWNPIGNKFFETFSYLPPLSDEEIARQVNYLLRMGLTPCLEFEPASSAYSDFRDKTDTSISSCMYENRYWSMWKLPMFGCTDPQQVLREIALCRQAFPDCFVRLVGFDSVRQVQSTGFLVQRPLNDNSYVRDVSKRSV